MSTHRVTLTDVAQRAAVSRTTASFVLSGRRDMRISADAQQRVLESARELNDRPNLLARSLRTNLSQTIGLISDLVATERFAGEVVRGSLSAALQAQHLLFVGETAGDQEVENQLVQGMLDRGVGGFVYASLYTRTTALTKLLRAHPAVLLNCVARGRPAPAVIPDERAAGRTAAQAVLDAGHRNGIYLVGEAPESVLAGHERRLGIEETLAEHQLALAGTVDSIWWPKPALAATSELLASGIRPTALICLNDRVAMGVYQALNRFGLTVPSDVSVISFDDSDLASWLDPTLTSIAIPYFEMGRLAIEMLLAPEPKPAVHRVPMPLRERASIAAPRPGAHRAGRSRESTDLATPAFPALNVAVE